MELNPDIDVILEPQPGQAELGAKIEQHWLQEAELNFSLALDADPGMGSSWINSTSYTRCVSVGRLG